MSATTTKLRLHRETVRNLTSPPVVFVRRPKADFSARNCEQTSPSMEYSCYMSCAETVYMNCNPSVEYTCDTL
jgi:hypothetical protein